ncbi:hypothetical protein CDAR_249871 [Caerostris darwini]|uniref:Uncharacterized protein n=1 Tax=Caerostris darwini TaxID=1538125 RepID=A0AAV4UTF7_9ARAC|nr:hypothetical protein CDAR_249871 [Caerostris darwini]
MSFLPLNPLRTLRTTPTQHPFLFCEKPFFAIFPLLLSTRSFSCSPKRKEKNKNVTACFLFTSEYFHFSGFPSHLPEKCICFSPSTRVLFSSPADRKSLSCRKKKKRFLVDNSIKKQGCHLENPVTGFLPFAAEICLFQCEHTSPLLQSRGPKSLSCREKRFLVDNSIKKPECHLELCCDW